MGGRQVARIVRNTESEPSGSLSHAGAEPGTEHLQTGGSNRATKLGDCLFCLVFKMFFMVFVGFVLFLNG